MKTKTLMSHLLCTPKNFKLYVWNFNVVAVKYKFKKKICNISNLGYSVLLPFRNKKKLSKLMLKLNNFTSSHSTYDYAHVQCHGSGTE